MKKNVFYCPLECLVMIVGSIVIPSPLLNVSCYCFYFPLMFFAVNVYFITT